MPGRAELELCARQDLRSDMAITALHSTCATALGDGMGLIWPGKVPCSCLIFTVVYLKASLLITLREGSKQSNGASSIFSCFLSVLAQRDEGGISAKS